MFIFCSKNKQCEINSIYTYITSYNFEKYSQGDFYQSSPYSIIVLDNTNEYYAIPINILYPIYKDIYKKNNFDFNFFVCEVLSNKISLNLSNIKDNSDVWKLSLDEKIIIEIEREGLFNLLDKYGISFVKGDYTMYSNDIEDTIIYEFYKNGYLFGWDDFRGLYIFSKVSK